MSKLSKIAAALLFACALAVAQNNKIDLATQTKNTLPHAQLPALVSGDIPNNAANTTGTAANLSGTPTLPTGTVLPGYLPLSGGTLTGLLSGTAFTATGTITAAQFCLPGPSCLNAWPSGAGGMVWPLGNGIPIIVNGESWGTTLAAPNGAIVGTTDTQSLTNKTLDGVSPATMGYLDVTSSIQTQLNAKAASATACVPGSFASQTDGATVTWAIASAYCANASLVFTTHGGNRTLNLTGLVNGGSYVLTVKQDSTGGEGLVLGSGCSWKVSNGGAGAVQLSTGANAIDVLAFTYDGTNCYLNFASNFD